MTTPLTTLAPSDDQNSAIRALNDGENVFLTGVAGTGKTYALNSWLDTQKKREDIAVTASTGIAATHIGGQTVHRWAGIGIGEYDVDHIVEEYYWRTYSREVIARTNTLIIDEISMLDARALDLIDGVCRVAKDDDDTPFGGIQVVFVGDMGQLPPVQLDNRFSFESDAWNGAQVRTIELTKVWRQEDAEFVKLLQEIRLGRLSDEGLQLLMTRRKAMSDLDGCTRLMTHNEMVDKINEEKLAALKATQSVYMAQEIGNAGALDWLDKNCLSPKVLKLKLGARIMCTKNTPQFANGELGTVTKLEPDLVHVRMDNDGYDIKIERCEWKTKKSVAKKNKNGVTEEVTGTRKQFPLRLAWAITIHKSQGMTIDKVSVDLGATFAHGQVYVALSRVRSLAGLNIERWGGVSSVRAHPKVLQFIGNGSNA